MLDIKILKLLLLEAVEKLNKTIEDYKKQIQNCTTQVEENDKLMNDKDVQIKTLETEKANNQKLVDMFKAKLKADTENSNKLNTQNDESLKKIELLDSELKTQTQNIKELNEKIHQLETEKGNALIFHKFYRNIN